MNKSAQHLVKHLKVIKILNLFIKTILKVNKRMERQRNDILVAVTKPVRGREMIAPAAIPADIFDVSAQRKNRDEDLTSALNKPSKDNVGMYYEGYLGGKKYLVPDKLSNLEAMRDVINLGMRLRKSKRYQQKTSADTKEELTLDRVEKILAKVRDFNISMSTNEAGFTSKLGKPDRLKEERMFKQWSPKSIELSQSSLGESEFQKSSSPKDDSSSSKTTRESESSEYISTELQSVVEKEEEESDDCYLRLLVSGHFKDNEKPMYIIQEYNTKSTLFCKQSADFTSSQTQGNVHIFMTGKLFDENILEENDGLPTSLNLKPNKIIIDANKCKIFRSYFENTYSRKATDITVKGEFLPNESSLAVTPYLSITLKLNNMRIDLSDFNNEMKREEKRPSILVRNRHSVTSSSTDISKDNKRVSFKESYDDKEVFVIYKYTKEKKHHEFIPAQVNSPKKEGPLQNGLNKNQGTSIKKQIMPKRKVLERMFYLITENSFFKKVFAKHK